MKRFYFKYMLGSLLGFLAVFTSCEDDMTVFNNSLYREVEMPISYTFSASVETRGESITPSLVKSCIYQFAPDGALVTKKNLGENDKSIRLYVPYTDQVTLQCVFIANASIEEIEGDKPVTNLTDLLNKQMTLTEDYVVTDETKMLMSSELVDVTNSTSSLSFELKPNLAKVMLTIKGFSPNHYNKIFYVQLRHVHNKVHFAHHAHTAEQMDAIQASNDELIRYESKFLTSQKFPQTWIWYVPHNALGTDFPEKTNNQHTFIVISAEQHEDWKTVRVPVYIAQREDGANKGDEDGIIQEDEVISFNVEAGEIYDIKVQLNQFNEIEEENITVELEKYVEFPENTNCHLLNPSTTPTGTVYSIPVSRAWEYWGTRLAANTEWKAEVIWQDIPAQVITFCSSDGVTTKDTDDGQGYDRNNPENSRFFLKLTDAANNPANHGNVVVGIKDKNNPNGGYLWSWHLWITNYNPNVAPTPSAAYPDNVFLVTGGEVHRYKDPFDASRNTVKKVFWSDPVNKDVVIMDRNLGAYSADPKDNTANNVFRNAGMYYQYGRKDPFPASHTYDVNKNNVAIMEGADAMHSLVTNLYDIYGKPKPKFTYPGGAIDRTDCVEHYANTQFDNDDQAAFDYSIQHPDVFITTPVGGSADWVPNSSYYVSNWNHQDTSKRDMYAKSIFDPCPLGWRVHRMGAMMIFSNDFRNKEMLNSIYVTGDFTINGIAVEDRYFYHRTISDNDNDATTFLQTNFNIASEEFIGSGENKIFNGYKFYFADYGQGPTTYYPRTNHRLTTNGFLVGTEDVCNWSIDGGLGDTDERHVDYIHYGYHLDFYSTAHGSYMDMPDSAGKAYGLAVRCIKENAQESQ